MPLEPFRSSGSLTLGVELELQLVSLASFDLVECSPDLLGLLSRGEFPGVVTPEVTQSMVEIATSVHSSHQSLLAELITMRDLLCNAAGRLNIGICGGGTHPFQQWRERRIFDRPRFRQVSHLYGYLTKQFTVFGQHVHVGCRSGNEALFLLHSLGRFVPQFIALSASSPCVQGVDTAFSSARLNSVSVFPLSGRAPFTLDWQDFESGYFRHMEATGVVAGMKDFYWDIRPKPEYGTVELRVCDTPLTVEHAAALAGYLQALCRLLLSGEEPDPVEDDYLVYSLNRFQACRFGLDGMIVHPKSLQHITLQEDILTTLRRVRPHAEHLGSVAAIDYLERLLERGGDAERLRRRLHQEGSVESLVAAAIGEFCADSIMDQSMVR